MSIPPVALPATSGPLVTRDCSYHGMTVRNTTAAAGTAQLNLRAGGATGTIIEAIDLAASPSSKTIPGDEIGTRAIGGVYFELVSGTVEGSVKIL